MQNLIEVDHAHRRFLGFRDALLQPSQGRFAGGMDFLKNVQQGEALPIPAPAFEQGFGRIHQIDWPLHMMDGPQQGFPKALDFFFFRHQRFDGGKANFRFRFLLLGDVIHGQQISKCAHFV